MKHDADDRDDKEDFLGPDFVILKDVNTIADDLRTGISNWGSVIATGVIDKDQGSDMRTIGDDEQASALCILKHQVNSRPGQVRECIRVAITIPLQLEYNRKKPSNDQVVSRFQRHHVTVDI